MNIRIIPQENRIEFIQADNNSYMSYSEVNPVYSNIQPSSNIEPPSGQAVYDNNDLDEYTYDDNNSDEYTYDDNYYGNGGTDLGSENSAYGRNADMVDSIALDEIIVECDYCGAPNIVRRNSGSCKCYFCWKEL